MLFNEKQPKFQSEVQKIIWAYGRAVVPFEVSTAEITDAEMLEGLRQVYDFNAEVFAALLENPEKHNANINTADMGRGALCFPRSLGEFVRFDSVSLSGNEWIINTNGLAPAKLKKIMERFNTIDLFKPMGISYESNNGVIRIRNTKYPLFVKYYTLLVKAAERRKADIWRHIVFCDFRILNNRFSVKFCDVLKFFSENNKAFALELHNFLLLKGCKANINCHSAGYVYKKHSVASIFVTVSSHCRHHTDLKRMSIDLALSRGKKDEIYLYMLNEIEKLPIKDELLSYLSDNRKRCNTMGCKGSEAENCGSVAFVVSINAENNDFSNNHDMNLLKQILDLRIKAIEFQQQQNITYERT